MKIEMLLKAVLVLLVVALVVTLTSWATSEWTTARAQGGGGQAGGNWIMVASELRAGEGLIYMFNTDKDVLLVYAYHRGRRRGGRGNTFDGDLQFLAGRHCKWDLLFSQMLPYPTERPKSGMHTPAQMKSMFEKASRAR
jgi:hypothetical protein